MAELGQKVTDLIIEKLGVEAEDITPDASFTNDLGADSLDTVELIMAPSYSNCGTNKYFLARSYSHNGNRKNYVRRLIPQRDPE